MTSSSTIVTTNYDQYDWWRTAVTIRDIGNKTVGLSSDRVLMSTPLYASIMDRTHLDADALLEEMLADMPAGYQHGNSSQSAPNKRGRSTTRVDDELTMSTKSTTRSAFDAMKQGAKVLFSAPPAKKQKESAARAGEKAAPVHMHVTHSLTVSTGELS